MPTNGKKKDSLLFAILDVINVLINFSFLKLCSALVTVTTHFVVVVVVVCFIQRPSKYIETTHITTFGRKKGNSDKTRTVKACNIQPYNKFKN